ncbi:hypothetical protein ACFVXG_23005 [Kitasatospora sp. NPDC058162]|uniref:hypothetical protein n=1 Tax=Kitasatospora sp. NPDC058162 TaxID=3346362 RepID=UPI0036DB46E8
MDGVGVAELVGEGGQRRAVGAPPGREDGPAFVIGLAVSDTKIAVELSLELDQAGQELSSASAVTF